MSIFSRKPTDRRSARLVERKQESAERREACHIRELAPKVVRKPRQSSSTGGPGTC